MEKIERLESDVSQVKETLDSLALQQERFLDGISSMEVAIKDMAESVKLLAVTNDRVERHSKDISFLISRVSDIEKNIIKNDSDRNLSCDNTKQLMTTMIDNKIKAIDSRGDARLKFGLSTAIGVTLGVFGIMGTMFYFLISGLNNDVDKLAEKTQMVSKQNYYIEKKIDELKGDRE